LGPLEYPPGTQMNETLDGCLSYPSLFYANKCIERVMKKFTFDKVPGRLYGKTGLVVNPPDYSSKFKTNFTD